MTPSHKFTGWVTNDLTQCIVNHLVDPVTGASVIVAFYPAKWLGPADAKPGETFGIWERDSDNREVLYRVMFSSVGEPMIEKRYR